jgi:hypothetical protein
MQFETYNSSFGSSLQKILGILERRKSAAVTNQPDKSIFYTHVH